MRDRGSVVARVIVLPDTQVIVGPMAMRRGILYADLDLGIGTTMKLRHDFAGDTTGRTSSPCGSTRRSGRSSARSTRRRRDAGLQPPRRRPRPRRPRTARATRGGRSGTPGHRRLTSDVHRHPSVSGPCPREEGRPWEASTTRTRRPGDRSSAGARIVTSTRPAARGRVAGNRPSLTRIAAGGTFGPHIDDYEHVFAGAARGGRGHGGQGAEDHTRRCDHHAA